MKILEIYKKYKIMPNLQIHQLRVAAVARLLVDNFEEELSDKKDIISAALLHDMGNIIKFKLDLYPQFLEPEGLDYWSNVQQEFFQKYGDDEHTATYKIAKEIGVSEETYQLINSVGFSKAANILNTGDYSQKIVLYSDQRVTPFHIVSMDERFKDGENRYKARKEYAQSDIDLKKKSMDALYEVEKQLFDKVNIHPEAINDTSAESVIQDLKSFEIV